MKLGFVLQITQRGNASESFSINKKEVWSHYIDDVRTPIKELNNFLGTEKVVYLVKFLGSIGYLICVIKSSPEGSPRPDDNTAAWVYFPSNVCISSEQTIRILHIVEEAISKELRTDYEQLENLFSNDYETNDVLISAVGTINSKKSTDPNYAYAVRYYNGDFILSELLGNYIAQKEYGNYKGIILIDKTSGVNHTSNSELNFEPQQICTYHPISPIDGFVPCLNNNYSPFDKSIEVPIGTPITIYWVKKGYVDIKKTFNAESGMIFPETAMINQRDYKVIIPKNLFSVKDHNGVPVSHFDVWIDRQRMEGETMEVLEARYQQGLAISITSSGFAEWKTNNLRISLGRQIDIYLSPKLFHYVFEIPICDGDKDPQEKAIVTVETFRKITSSPIKGYTTFGDRIQEGEGHTNSLSWDEGWLTKFKYMAYGFASCIFVILLYAGYHAMDNYKLYFDWPPIKRISNTAKSSIADVNYNTVNKDSINAINYLETNEVWCKDSLDHYEMTKGLFEELNEFNLNALRNRKEGLLKGSVKLSNLVDHLIKYCDGGNDPRVGKEKSGGRYNSLTDKEIELENYLKWLTERHTPIEMFSSGESAPKGHKTHSSGNTIKSDNKRADQTPSEVHQPKGNSSRGKL